MIICNISINLAYAKASAEELTENINNPLLSSMSLVTGYKFGKSDGYLISIINGKDIDILKYGESVCIFSPTVSGKTKTIEQISSTISKNEEVIILTNRRACKIQLIKDLLKGNDGKSISDKFIDQIKIDNDIKVMTYQNFIMEKTSTIIKNLFLYVMSATVLRKIQRLRSILSR